MVDADKLCEKCLLEILLSRIDTLSGEVILPTLFCPHFEKGVRLKNAKEIGSKFSPYYVDLGQKMHNVQEKNRQKVVKKYRKIHQQYPVPWYF